MSKLEILEELPKLSAEDRFEIRLKIAELDDDPWLEDQEVVLTPEQIALLDERIAEHERDPASAIPWSEFKQDLWAEK